MRYEISNNSAPAMTPQKGHNIVKKWHENFLSQALKGMFAPLFPCFFYFFAHTRGEGKSHFSSAHGTNPAA